MNRKDAILLLGMMGVVGCHNIPAAAPSREARGRGNPALAKSAVQQPIQPVSHQAPPIPVSRGALAVSQPTGPASLPPAPAAVPAFEPVPTAKSAAAPTPATPVSFDPAPPPSPAAAPAPAPEQAVSDVRRLYQSAAERSASLDSYIARLRRREVVNGKQKPEEIALFKFRKEPWCVFFKWIGTEAKGREAIYVKGHYDDKVHTLLAAGDMLLMPAGTVFALDPHNPMMLRHSRHPITEAGIGSLVERFGRLVELTEARKSAELRYLGPQQRAEYPGSLEAVEQAIPLRAEAHLPGGGRRWWFFDPASGLPVLVITHDEAGREVEYYCYDRIQYPVKLDDDDFNPNKLWTRR